MASSSLALYDPAYASRQKQRLAGAMPEQLLQQGKEAVLNAGADLSTRFKGLNQWSPRKIGLGAGAVGLGALMSALGELNNEDPLVTNEQRVAGAAGAAGGSALGGIGGAALAGLLGGGPVGALVLGSLAAAAGGAVGGGAGRGLMGAFGPSPQDKELQRQLKAAQLQTDAEKYRLQTLGPLQQQMAEMVLVNEAKRAALLAPIEAQRQRQAALAQGLLQAQQASAAQSLAGTQALYGTVI